MFTDLVESTAQRARVGDEAADELRREHDRIVAAACYLPLSESPSISRDLGTRHRAALGISEVTDALTIVVSEETGSISYTKNGELYRNVSEEQLAKVLTKNLTQTMRSEGRPLNWRGRKNG